MVFLVLAFDTATIIPLEAFAIFYTTVYSILPSIAGGLSLSIKVAVLNLYGAWEALPEHSIRLIESACASGRYGELYAATRQGEQAALKTLVQFEQNNPGQLNEERIDAVLDDAANPPRESVREVLRRLQAEREAANPTNDEPNHQQNER